MMMNVDARRSINRTLAVIDGGLNATADVQTISTASKPKLLDQVRQAIRTRQLSRHPVEMGETEIAGFLSSLASDGHVSASTQNQALNALLFLYKEILEKKIGLIQGVVRANRPKRLPVVLSKEEVKCILDRLENTPWLMAMLLYGAGLRLLECCHLRVKDIDFARNQIVVRAGKGNKDRYTMLPAVMIEPLRKHLQAVKQQHEEDLKRELVVWHCPMLWSANIPMPASKYQGKRLQTCGMSHLAAFFCDAFAGKWVRYPNGSGATGAQGC